MRDSLVLQSEMAARTAHTRLGGWEGTDTDDDDELTPTEERLTATVVRLHGEIAELEALLDRAHRNYDSLQASYDEKASQVQALERELAIYTGRVPYGTVVS